MAISVVKQFNSCWNMQRESRKINYNCHAEETHEQVQARHCHFTGSVVENVLLENRVITGYKSYKSSYRTINLIAYQDGTFQLNEKVAADEAMRRVCRKLTKQ